MRAQSLPALRAVRFPSWVAVAVLALTPLWFAGIMHRALWTPDEPREADIAWNMSLQSDRTINYTSPAASEALPVKITVETTVAAPIEDVWRAYTTPEDIKQWNAASDDWHTTAAMVDLRVGGAFSSRMEAKDGSMGFDFEGTYTNIVEHELIEYSFGDRTAQVEFADDPKGVRVRVTFDSESTYPVEQQREGWQAILNNFTRHVEASR